MNSSSQSTTGTCAYCGHENLKESPACAGCGTPLVNDASSSINTNPKRKSKYLAVILALIFGPLGLLYVRAWWPAFIMMLIGASFLLTHTGGIWIPIGARIIAAAWAYAAVTEQAEDPNVSRDSARMLGEAAHLESVDISKSVAAYEEIIQLFPGTPASAEAARNIETLKRHIVPDNPSEEKFS